MLPSHVKDRLLKHLPEWSFYICIIQPVLDVISYLSVSFGIPNVFTLGLRLMMLAAVLLSAIIITNNKKYYLYSFAVLTVYSVCHITACILNGYGSPVSDLINLVRIFQLPCVTICFITFVKNDNRVYSSLKKGLMVCFIIIVTVELISVITKTNPYTYENKQIGIIGWFNDSSAQSAILSGIVPVVIAMISDKFKNKLTLLFPLVILSAGVLYLYATRLAYITILIIFTGLLTIAFFKYRGSVKQIICFSLALILFIALIPVSPMTKNREMVDDNAIKKQERIDALIAEFEIKANEEGLSGKEYDVARLEGAYTEYLAPMIHRFGLEKTVDRYNFTEKASQICDVRLMKNTYCSMLLEEQGVLSLLFGMELGDMSFEDVIFDVENDFHGIFYLTGITGLILISAFILYFVFLMLRSLFKDFKRVFTVENAGIAISLISLLLHVYATCGVLRRPSASIYLSIIFVMIYNQTLIAEKKGL